MVQDHRFTAFVKSSEIEGDSETAVEKSHGETLEKFAQYIAGNYDPEAWKTFEIWDNEIDEVVKTGTITG